MSEKKSLFEIVLMPLALAVVGGAGTYFITDFQAKHAAVLAQAQRDAAQELAQAQIESAEQIAQRDQAVKVLELYQDRIDSDDPEKRKIALQLLLLVDPVLGKALAEEIERTDESGVVREEARKVKKEVATEEVEELIGRFNGPDRLRASNRLLAIYRQGDEASQDAMVEALINALLPADDSRSYRVNIYIVLTLSRLEPAWRATAHQLQAIENLKKTTNYKDSTFKRRVDEAIANSASP